MEAFVTGTTIKKLREEKRITQGELATEEGKKAAREAKGNK